MSSPKTAWLDRVISLQWDVTNILLNAYEHSGINTQDRNILLQEVKDHKENLLKLVTKLEPN